MENEKRQKFATQIGKRIQKVRGDRSLTKFAEELGIWPASLTNYENGVNVPGAYVLRHIAKHEQINLNWLVFGHGDQYLH